MTDRVSAPDGRSAPFTGEVGEPHPYATFRFDYDLVALRVRPIRGVLRKGEALLVNGAGEARLVRVVGMSFPTPALDTLATWEPGDAIVYLDGISLEEARDASWLWQDHS